MHSATTTGALSAVKYPGSKGLGYATGEAARASSRISERAGVSGMADGSPVVGCGELEESCGGALVQPARLKNISAHTMASIRFASVCFIYGGSLSFKAFLYLINANLFIQHIIYFVILSLKSSPPAASAEVFAYAFALSNTARRALPPSLLPQRFGVGNAILNIFLVNRRLNTAWVSLSPRSKSSLER